MAAGWCTRTLRAALFAAVCVLLAALGHVMMSGVEAPAWVLAAGLAVTGAAGWCLAGRERGLPLIMTVVLAAQTLLHTAFSLAGPEPADAMDMNPLHMGGMSGMAGGSGMGGMDMGGMSGMSGLSHAAHASHAVHMGHLEHLGHIGSAGSMDHVSAAIASSSFGMLAAHLIAALLCGLWLAHGEKAAFRILRAVAGRLAAPLRLLLALPAPPERPRVRFSRRGSERKPRLLLLTYTITTRGPPQRPAAAV